jgi:hypothetical protein
MTIEEKLAKSLVDDAKGRVNEEIRTLKTADKPSQKVGLDVIDDEKIKKLVEFRKSIPQENLPLYKRELEKANARLSYLDYLRYTDSQFIPTKFHRLLAQIIQDTVEKVEKGEHIRICLSVPPRHGKTYMLAETLPTWFVGRNPDSMAILTAYNTELAEKFGDKNRQKAKETLERTMGFRYFTLSRQ